MQNQQEAPTRHAILEELKVPSQPPSEREQRLEAIVQEAVRLFSLLKYSHLTIQNPDLEKLLERKEGTSVLPHGNTFKGSLVNGQPNGPGTARYAFIGDEDWNDYTVTGEMYNGKWEGECTKQYHNDEGTVFRYTCHMGKDDGWFQVERPNGSISMDSHRNGRSHGPSYYFDGETKEVKFTMWDKGEEKGEMMQISADKNEMRFTTRINHQSHGEMRIFKLDRIEIWGEDQCLTSTME